MADNLDSLLNTAIRARKQLAMGKQDTIITGKTRNDSAGEDGGWPGRCGPEKDAALTRGEGRKPDATKSGMPSGGSTRPLWLDVGDTANPGDRIAVKEHTRAKPGGNGTMGWE